MVPHAAPLIAIDAVAIDTETTGLDPRRAAIIEIAARRLHGAEPASEIFETLVATDVAVPAAATAIHGLTNEDLTGAPDFIRAWERLHAVAGDRVWIGYAIGFDIAALKRHCEERGLAWTAPVALDVRLLAQHVDPRLPDYALESLCAWRGIEVRARHRAAADADLAAKLYASLLPDLRARGVRTLGEARAACRRLSGDAADAAAFGENGEDVAVARVDSYPYRHRVRDVMNPKPAFAAPDATLAAALQDMMTRQVSSLYVGSDSDPAGEIGILTERDALRALAGDADALRQPVSRFASRPLIAVPADAFVYRAIGRMHRRRIRHLAVTGARGEIVGAVSARDLLRLRATAALALGDDIDEARTLAELGRAWAKLPDMAAGLITEDVDARRIAAVIASEVGALTRKAALMAEERLRAEGAGDPPCAYAVLVLGSAGRGESLLAMDQDNAILFAAGAPDGPEDRWFARLGAIMTEILDTVGVPFCKGGVMASQPAYRGSFRTWSDRIGEWIGRSSPGDLLSVDIFFDFRAVHGDHDLASRLWDHAWRAARGRNAFLKLLAHQGEGAEHPFGLFGGWRAGPDGRIDLKNIGLRRIVSGARVLALHDGVALHATHERLTALAQSGEGAAADLVTLDDAHQLVLATILRQQIADIRAGAPPTNRIDPLALTRPDQRRLKRALERVEIVDELVRARLTD